MIDQPKTNNPIQIELAVCTLQYCKRMVDHLLYTIKANIFSGWAIPDICLLPFARNAAVRLIYEGNPHFTHILFIDDDMCGFGPEHVAKLCHDDVDIISAVVTTRKEPYKLVAAFPQDLTLEECQKHIKDKSILETEHVGLAFTLIKRAVFDALREETPDGPIWFDMDRFPRESFDADILEFIKEISDSELTLREKLESAIIFGQQAHVGGQLLGEDISFSHKARAFGFRCWVDMGVHVGHIGERTFDIRDNFRHSINESNKKPELKLVGAE